MDIFKALKREKRISKQFYTVMIGLLIILPLSIYLTRIYTSFFLISLITLEILIMLAIVTRINSTKINYSCLNNRLKYKSGLFSKEGLVFCDKVILVHTEKMEEEMEVYILTTINLKNKNLKLVGKGLLNRLPALNHEYKKIKKKNGDILVYYQVIKKGGLKKYLFLDTIYKNCVKAVYTNNCIKNIKIARGQTLV